MIRPPKNQIIENLYTGGNEFITERSYKIYSGYYHSQSGKNYVGANYNPNAVPLIPITINKVQSIIDINTVDPTYLAINPNIINVIKQDNFEIVRYKYSSTEGPKQRYFIKQINKLESPIIEVTQDTFLKAKINPFYRTTSIYWSYGNNSNNYLEKIEKDIPGVLSFIENS